MNQENDENDSGVEGDWEVCFGRGPYFESLVIGLMTIVMLPTLSVRVIRRCWYHYTLRRNEAGASFSLLHMPAVLLSMVILLLLTFVGTPLAGIFGFIRLRQA